MAVRSTPQPAKHWVFTLNNPTEHLHFNADWMEALSYQLEKGKEGTLHFQGALSLVSRKRMPYLKKHFSKKAHYEVMRSKPAAGHAYANKEDTRVPDADDLLAGPRKYGVIPVGQGKRSDLDLVTEEILKGTPMVTVARTYPKTYVRFYAGLERLRAIDRSGRAAPPAYPLSSFDAPIPDLSLPVVLSGSTGIGKTSLALAHFERPMLVSHLDQLRDLDYPKVHDGLVFDDMSFAHLPAQARIHLTDWEHTRSIHIRYTVAEIPARCPRIFTTNIGMDCLLSPTDDREIRAAIERRVCLITLTQSVFTEPEIKI